MNTEKIDVRSLSDDTLYEIRKQVISLHLAGQSKAQIARSSQLSYSGVVKIIRLYELSGNVVPKPALRGRKKGEQRLLDPDMEATLQEMIRANGPDAYGLNFHVWSREALAALIQQKDGKDLPLRTVSHYMERWGYAAQQLQNPHLARQKLLEYRSEKQDSVTRAELYWLKQEPRSTLNAQDTRVISVINGRGSLRWLCCSGDAHTALQSFLQALLADMAMLKKNVLVLGLHQDDVGELVSLKLQSGAYHLRCVLEAGMLTAMDTEPEQIIMTNHGRIWEGVQDTHVFKPHKQEKSEVND